LLEIAISGDYGIVIVGSFPKNAARSNAFPHYDVMSLSLIESDIPIGSVMAISAAYRGEDSKKKPGFHVI
jgi:hypothetical protein